MDNDTPYDADPQPPAALVELLALGALIAGTALCVTIVVVVCCI